jgi:DNA-binding NarL/FixJ family response regulator
MIRLAIVDDHEVVREGLCSFLKAIPDIDIVGQGACGEDAVSLVAVHQPDILLLDMKLPDFTGLEALKKIQQLSAVTKVVFLSSYSDPATAIPAIREGASGFLLKDINPKDLVVALHEVAQGAMKLHSDIAALLVNELIQTDNEPDVIKLHKITERECEVISLIGQGLSNKEISSKLNISLLTVKTHVSHILEKLKLNDRTQVAIFAIHNQLVDVKR